MKQLQTLAKQNGIAIARTKADFLKLLDDAEPGVHHGDLSGEALKAKLTQYKIGALRSKEDLVALLAQKQAALKQAVDVAQQVAKLPPASGLSDLTVKELQEMAATFSGSLGKGISLNMTKQDVIDMLDQVKPGVDHSGLSGQALVAAKQKHGIGVLKNKQQLVQALEKAAGQELAEKTKQEALDAAKKETLQMINLGIGLLVFRGMQRARWSDPGNQLLVVFLVVFIPMLISFGGRYFVQTMGLWCILAAGFLADWDLGHLNLRRKIKIGFLPFLPSVILAGSSVGISSGPIPLPSAWCLPPAVVVGCARLILDGKTTYAYADIVRLGSIFVPRS